MKIPKTGITRQPGWSHEIWWGLGWQVLSTIEQTQENTSRPGPFAWVTKFELPKKKTPSSRSMIFKKFGLVNCDLLAGRHFFVNKILLITILGNFSNLRASLNIKASLRRLVARPESRPKERTGKRHWGSRTLCAPQPTSSSPPPAHSTRPSLIGWAAARSRCHWPGVHGGGRRETYLSELPQECYCARRRRLSEVAVKSGKAGSLRRRCRYVGDGREPRACGGWADRRLSGGRALLWGPRASLRAGRERPGALREQRAVAAGLVESRPRRHWGSELAGKPLAKGERTRLHRLPSRSLG